MASISAFTHNAMYKVFFVPTTMSGIQKTLCKYALQTPLIIISNRKYNFPIESFNLKSFNRIIYIAFNSTNVSHVNN